MVNSFYDDQPGPLPALIIGAPAHAGKSILAFNLSKALRNMAKEVPHLIYRACPDGEGDWVYQANPDEVELYRKKGQWTDEFRNRAYADITSRLVPFIVDIGGKPTDEDYAIIAACTDAMLITRDVTQDDKEPEKITQGIQNWRNVFAANAKLPLFAEIHSQRSGATKITSWDSTFKASINIQERQDRLSGHEFDSLAARVARLFSSVSTPQLEDWHMRHAPQGFTHIYLSRVLQKEFFHAREWAPNMLERLMSRLPREPLAVYGRAPVWVYGALALLAPDQPFSQFDPRYGWITPPSIQSGTPRPGQKVITSPDPQMKGNRYIIPIHIPDYYLDYKTETDVLFFSDPPPRYGVIISGKLPLWLFTALARFYAQKQVAWLALHAANMDKAVVIYSQPHGSYRIGESVALR